MNDYPKTFEEIEAHLDQSDVLSYQNEAALREFKTMVTANPAGALEKICKVYKGIKPILEAIVRIPLIPAKFRNALKALMAILNTICG